MTDEEIAAENKRLADERAKLDADKLAFSEQQTKTRNATNNAAIDGLAAEGKVTPADAEDLKLAFAALDGDKVIAFSDKAEASPASRILAIMAKGGKVVPVGDTKVSPDGSNPAFTAGEGGEAKANYDKAREEQLSRYGK